MGPVMAGVKANWSHIRMIACADGVYVPGTLPGPAAACKYARLVEKNRDHIKTSYKWCNYKNSSTII